MMPSGDQPGAALSLLQREYDFGLALLKQGRPDKARLRFAKVLEANPDSAPALNCVGVTYLRQGNMDLARAHFQRASKLNPAFAMPQSNLGWVLIRQRRLDLAAAHFQQALLIEPTFDQPHLGLGRVCLAQGRLQEATSHFEEALANNPTSADAYYGLGCVLRARTDLQAAVAAFQRAIHLRPHFPTAIAQLIYLFHRTCQWGTLQALTQQLDALTINVLQDTTKPILNPAYTLRYCTCPSRHLGVARAWSRDLSQSVSTIDLGFSFGSRRRPRERLRIGYASGTFGNHPVTHYMRGLLTRHDRRQFDILLYARNTDDGSSERAMLRAACDVIVDISLLSVPEAAMKIYGDGIDILIDLDGHHENGLLDIFALRPAPIQVAYLGFPATTGADFIDYIIVDKTVCPEEHVPCFSEAPVYMPHTFAVDSNSAHAIRHQHVTRSQYNLPEDAIVFCSFNVSTKIDAIIFDTWMRILRQVPRSVLWLVRCNAIAKENLKREAEARGVDAQRLRFAEHVDIEEHINRLRLADVALDTVLYNGGATTSNALAAGVPVVTVLGDRFAARMTASMVRSVGLPELVADSLGGYEALVLDLARRPEELSRVRNVLRDKRESAPLFDERRFAGNLEKAFLEMWRIFQAGAEPRGIEIVDDD